MEKFFDMTNVELQIMRRALKCLIGELDWENQDTLREEEFLDEVENELGHRFNAEQI